MEPSPVPPVQCPAKLPTVPSTGHPEDVTSLFMQICDDKDKGQRECMHPQPSAPEWCLQESRWRTREAIFVSTPSSDREVHNPMF